MSRKAHPIPTRLVNFVVPVGIEASVRRGPTGESMYSSLEAPHAGLLIMNADDWGRDHETTDRTLECIDRGSVSSVSTMVFMADSARAAAIARGRGIDAGLHLNFTTPFSSLDCPAQLRERQRELANCLLRHRLSQVLFYPNLIQSFKYVVSAQLDEFRRLYGAATGRIDGHHHMHLSANVLLQGLLPSGTIVRRHFSYEPGEKMLRNSVFRLYSRALLGGRYRVTDFFFSLPPLAPEVRLQRMFSLTQRSVVELETHPINPEEYRFLTGGDLIRWTMDCPPALNFSNAVGSFQAKDSLRTQ